MTHILKKTLLIAMLIMMIQAIFTQLSVLDETLLRDLAQTFLIALCLQPWIMRQFTH